MGLLDPLSEEPAGLFTGTLKTLPLGLDHLSGARPERRPRWYEVDRLEVKQVRPLVQVGQESVVLNVGAKGRPLMLSLLWLERWGGTFGTRSSAEANRKRGRTSGERFLERRGLEDGTAALDPDTKGDRGQVPAWLLYLACPRCARRCRVLYSRRGQHHYGCPKCERPAAPSNCWQASGSGGPADAWQRQRLMHQDAALRIRRRYLGDIGPRTGGLLAPARLTLPRPKGMTWRRFDALARLVEAHETLAMMAALGGLQQSLARILGKPSVLSLEERKQDQRVQQWAKTVLRVDAWALRQTSWHRRGRPRDTPGEGTRAKAAKLETSTDNRGHAQEAA